MSLADGVTWEKEFGYKQQEKANWVETDLSTALHSFALGYKIECRINFSTWEFDFSKHNATVVLNRRMIDRGKWYVCTEK